MAYLDSSCLGWFVVVSCAFVYLAWTVASLGHIFASRSFLWKCGLEFKLQLNTLSSQYLLQPLLETEGSVEDTVWREEDVPAKLGYDSVSGIHKVVVAECLWDISQSFLGVGATVFVYYLGLRGSPAFDKARSGVVWAMFGLPCAVRGKWQEARLMHVSPWSLLKSDFKDWQSFPSFPYISSLPTIIDGFSHGNVACEALLAGDFSVEIGELWGTEYAFVKHILQSTGYGGLMAGSLALAAIWHMGILCFDGAALPVKASLAGFGALDRQLSKTFDGDYANLAANAMAKLRGKFLGESLLFLEFSVSLAMAKAMRNDHNVTADATLTMNVFLSLFTAALAIKGVISPVVAQSSYKAVSNYVWELRRFECKAWLALFRFIAMFLIPVTLAAFFVSLKAYTFLRADSCPRHAWGLTTGCL